MAVWWSARVEINGAIARLQRDGEIDTAGSNAARSALTKLMDSWYEVAPGDEVRDRAEELLGQFPLRAADRLQLGAALVWSGDRPKGRVFLCADAKLAEAAEQAGFLVMKP
jgi:predicted nucleic acid-binding protein